MIKNKRLFIITLVVGLLLCAGIDVPFLILRKMSPYSLLGGIFFIVNAILGTAIYTLIYISLKKTDVVKKVYRFALLIAIAVFAMGVCILVGVAIS